MPGNSSHNRRRHPRLPVDASVRVSTIDPEIDPYTGRPFFRAFEEECANLSRGGMLVHTREALAPGRRVLVEVLLPAGPIFETVARVAWAGSVEERPNLRGLGFEFLGGSPQHGDRLAKLLEARSQATF
jgi:hypothetical protein